MEEKNMFHIGRTGTSLKIRGHFILCASALLFSLTLGGCVTIRDWTLSKDDTELTGGWDLYKSRQGSIYWTLPLQPDDRLTVQRVGIGPSATGQLFEHSFNVRIAPDGSFELLQLAAKECNSPCVVRVTNPTVYELLSEFKRLTSAASNSVYWYAQIASLAPRNIWISEDSAQRHSFQWKEGLTLPDLLDKLPFSSSPAQGRAIKVTIAPYTDGKPPVDVLVAQDGVWVVSDDGSCERKRDMFIHPNDRIILDRWTEYRVTCKDR